MGKELRLWVGLVILVLATAALVAAAGSGDTWVRVLPASGDYYTGQQIGVEVVIEDVENLYAADVRLNFDAARLEVLDANPALPGVQVAPRSDLLSADFVIRNEVDNVSGTVWYAVTQVRPSEPVTGSGALFSFNFLAVATGTAAVTVQQHLLSTPNGVVIPASPDGAVYTITVPKRLFLPLITK